MQMLIYNFFHNGTFSRNNYVLNSQKKNSEKIISVIFKVKQNGYQAKLPLLVT